MSIFHFSNCLYYSILNSYKQNVNYGYTIQHLGFFYGTLKNFVCKNRCNFKNLCAKQRNCDFANILKGKLIYVSLNYPEQLHMKQYGSHITLYKPYIYSSTFI